MPDAFKVGSMFTPSKTWLRNFARSSRDGERPILICFSLPVMSVYVNFVCVFYSVEIIIIVLYRFMLSVGVRCRRRAVKYYCITFFRCKLFRRCTSSKQRRAVQCV